MSDQPVGITVESTLSPADAAAVVQLAQQATAADGVHPFSDEVMLHLRAGSEPHRHHLLARRGTELAGYAALDTADASAGSSAELAVAPTQRCRGTGSALLDRLISLAPGGRLRIWVHGAYGPGGAGGRSAGVARLADRGHLVPTRTLWQLRRSLAEPLPDVQIPDEVSIRAFVPGRDEPAWIALNNAAFAGHPEQSGWSEHDLALRAGEPWFDPEGFLLAERVDGPGEPRLVGFHWTKVHERDETGPADRRDQPIGEVYVVGVDPAESGRGLGRALTLAGLHHLRGRGLSAVLLYVDEDNSRAVATYERLGFQRYRADVSYQR